MFLARRRREFGEVGCGRHIVLSLCGSFWMKVVLQIDPNALLD